MLSELEAKEREQTGIKNLKINYNRVFGYYIEISKSNLLQVPDSYERRQTLTNGERFVNRELKALESEILSASEKANALENEIYEKVRSILIENSQRIQKTAKALAKLDVLISLAAIAQKNNYVCPELSLGNEIDIFEGRHPCVELILKDKLFVPNDTYLDTKKHNILIITGPNMAGKSTYMRQTALIVFLAQIGSFVPARSAKIGIVDKIFTRIGASDDLIGGQSTFMVEMSEVAEILKNATNKSFLILDEIGRGTSTFDGMSIARAVLEYISKTVLARTMFSTHYHEIIELENELNNVKNINVAVKKRDNDIIFLRKIVDGGTDDSYGIDVANLAGIPNKVITRAKEILSELETKQPVKKKQSEQFSVTDLQSESVIEKLKKLHPETLTPIEALNALYELYNDVKSI